ncbi:MAG: NCS2 family permease [Opitutaceae bacterium]
MAYILAVNPAILADAGMDRGALVTVTALTAAVSTVIMALLTNYPIALAPGMGINAFFTYTICLGSGVPWQQALGMVFINGIVFLALSVTGVRQKIVAAIPYPQTGHHLRNRPFYCVHRTKERRSGGLQPGHLGHSWKPRVGFGRPLPRGHWFDCHPRRPTNSWRDCDWHSNSSRWWVSSSRTAKGGPSRSFPASSFRVRCHPHPCS